MKKVLILAYDFYPYNSIGAQRPYSWYKYFHQNNLYPVVITRHWDNEIKKPEDVIKPSKAENTVKLESSNGTIIYTRFKPNLRDRILNKYGLNKYSFLRKSLTLFFNVFKYIFNIDTTREIYNAANEFLINEKCDIIIATGEPFILFKYASKLSSKHKIPWAADYRDGWTTEQAKKNIYGIEKILFRYYGIIESCYLKNVALITTASPSYKQALEKKIKSKKIEVIYNGYFSEIIDEVIAEKEIRKDNLFKIAYSGTLYDHQNLEMFLEGFKKFINTTTEKNIKIYFYGLNFFPSQKKRVLEFDSELKKHFEFTDRLPIKEVLKELYNSDILLLLSQKNANWLNAKIFDYLALNKKILLVENDHGILEQIIDECNGGVKCETAEDVFEILKIIYLRYIENGIIDQHTTNVEKYSRRYQTRILADFILKLNPKTIN